MDTTVLVWIMGEVMIASDYPFLRSEISFSAGR